MSITLKPRMVWYDWAMEPQPDGTYFDYRGHRWQNVSGQWYRRVESDRYLSAWNPYQWGDPAGVDQGTWLPDDPNRPMPFDVSPYTSVYTDYLYRYFDEYAWRDEEGMPRYLNPEAYNDPRVIDAMFEGGPVTNLNANPANTNPYASVQNRDMLRRFAVSLGLTPLDADKAAFQEATNHYNTQGQPYSEATALAVIGDDIAHLLAAQAGVIYKGLTPEQRADAAAAAQNLQDNMKGHREAFQNAQMWVEAGNVLSIVTAVIGGIIAAPAAAASEAATESTAAAAASTATTASTAMDTSLVAYDASTLSMEVAPVADVSVAAPATTSAIDTFTGFEVAAPVEAAPVAVVYDIPPAMPVETPVVTAPAPTPIAPAPTPVAVTDFYGFDTPVATPAPAPVAPAPVASNPFDFFHYEPVTPSAPTPTVAPAPVAPAPVPFDYGFGFHFDEPVAAVVTAPSAPTAASSALNPFDYGFPVDAPVGESLVYDIPTVDTTPVASAPMEFDTPQPVAPAGSAGSSTYGDTTAGAAEGGLSSQAVDILYKNAPRFIEVLRDNAPATTARPSTTPTLPVRQPPTATTPTWWNNLTPAVQPTVPPQSTEVAASGGFMDSLVGRVALGMLISYLLRS